MDNKHNEDQKNKNNESANIIQKLFKVVEKFTEKVTRLENLSLKNIQCIKYMKIVNYQWRRINYNLKWQVKEEIINENVSSIWRLKIINEEESIKI